uniref:XPA_C domain-containing protein n=1 Tax=Heterorhabditis bacteriophora TaxID=37862 RepID=A0A1I7XGU9_HETBA
MSKRRFNPTDEDKTPIVEKLYRENQPSFHGAGGFMDDDDEYQQKRESIAEARQKSVYLLVVYWRLDYSVSSFYGVLQLHRVDAHYSHHKIPDNCIKCKQPLFDSWLWERYNHPVCDTCRDDKGDHKLIARTDVKAEYLLKDCDLDLRKPPLRFWSKKNPHNPRYGDMKLYLKCQVVIDRMLEIYESWEKFEAEKQLRAAQKESRAEKNFEKKVKEMRQHIRGVSGVKVQATKAHEHEYGPESYNDEKDEYSKTCTLCDYVLVYEKM